jgi:hypothetical protein
MLRLIETASSAFAAASVLAVALGFAIVGMPLWADEPLNSVYCGGCTADGCPQCPNQYGFYCETNEDTGCGCSCEPLTYGDARTPNQACTGDASSQIDERRQRGR